MILQKSHAHYILCFDQFNAPSLNSFKRNEWSCHRRCPTGGVNTEQRSWVSCPHLTHMFCGNVKQLDGTVLQANHNDILRAPSRPWASSVSCEPQWCPALISRGSGGLNHWRGRYEGSRASYGVCVCSVLPSIRQSEVTHNPTEVLTDLHYGQCLPHRSRPEHYSIHLIPLYLNYTLSLSLFQPLSFSLLHFVVIDKESISITVPHVWSCGFVEQVLRRETLILIF